MRKIIIHNNGAYITETHKNGDRINFEADSIRTTGKSQFSLIKDTECVVTRGDLTIKGSLIQVDGDFVELESNCIIMRLKYDSLECPKSNYIICTDTPVKLTYFTDCIKWTPQIYIKRYKQSSLFNLIGIIRSDKLFDDKSKVLLVWDGIVEYKFKVNISSLNYIAIKSAEIDITPITLIDVSKTEATLAYTFNAPVSVPRCLVNIHNSGASSYSIELTESVDKDREILIKTRDIMKEVSYRVVLSNQSIQIYMSSEISTNISIIVPISFLDGIKSFSPKPAMSNTDYYRWNYSTKPISKTNNSTPWKVISYS